jgi:hypothetical protein
VKRSKTQALPASRGVCQQRALIPTALTTRAQPSATMAARPPFRVSCAAHPESFQLSARPARPISRLPPGSTDDCRRYLGAVSAALFSLEQRHSEHKPEWSPADRSIRKDFHDDTRWPELSWSSTRVDHRIDSSGSAGGDLDRTDTVFLRRRTRWVRTSRRRCVRSWITFRDDSRRRPGGLRRFWLWCRLRVDPAGIAR